MTTSYARCPSITSQAWADSLNIAKNMSSTANPIGKSLWFNTNDVYKARSSQFSGWEGYSFDRGNSYKKVVEKHIIGSHTFFRVQGY